MICENTRSEMYAGTIYIWPTKNCNVGCSHCNFSSAYPRVRRTPYLQTHKSLLYEFVSESDAWKIVISGGGEPLLESETCYDIIANIKSRRLKEVEVITSGHWARSIRNCNQIISSLIAANKLASNIHRPRRLVIRLSIDYYHVERSGLSPAINIIHDWLRRGRSDFDLYIRSTLIGNDTSVSDLCKEIGAVLSINNDYHHTITLKDSSEIPVYYKNLILDGSMTADKLESDGLFIPKQSLAKNFIKRCEVHGRHIPSCTYNSIKPVLYNGLSLIVEDDGTVKILESTAPDLNINIALGYHGAINSLLSDPLTRFLTEYGPRALLIAMKREDLYWRYLDKYNQIYYLIDKILKNENLLDSARVYANLHYM